MENSHNFRYFSNSRRPVTADDPKTSVVLKIDAPKIFIPMSPKNVKLYLLNYYQISRGYIKQTTITALEA